MLHAKAMNFSGIMENISAATKSIDYFAGKKFIPLTDSGIPELISPIKDPPKIIKIKKKTKKKKSHNKYL